MLAYLLTLVAVFAPGQVIAHQGKPQDAAAKPQLAASSDMQSVAVVGGGVGGAFASYFLWQLSQTSDWDVKIDVYERDQLGGRAQAFEFKGHALELGASMVYGGNAYIADHLQRLGLQRRADSSSGVFNIFDGQQVVLQTSEYSLITLLRMLLRYQWALLRFALLPLRLVWRFNSIYTLQDAGQAYETPEAMLRAMGVYDWTQHSFADMLQDKLGSGSAAQRLCDELLGAINRVNYNQHNSHLNAMVGLVSTLPSVDTRTFAIQGGNGQLAVRLLGHARANVYENVTVTRVVRDAQGAYHIDVAGNDALERGEARGPYAAVILAAPLSLSGVRLEGNFDPPLQPIPDIEYQSTVTTYVHGALNPDYFGMQSIDGAVFVSDSADVPFSSIAPRLQYPDFTAVYKLFSSRKLSDPILDAIFHPNYTVLTSKSWRAYPVYSPPERFAPFELAQGLYYNNALEAAASAMEVAAIAGRNSALLAARLLEKAAHGSAARGAAAHAAGAAAAA